MIIPYLGAECGADRFGIWIFWASLWRLVWDSISVKLSNRLLQTAIRLHKYFRLECVDEKREQFAMAPPNQTKTHKFAVYNYVLSVSFP